MSENTIETPVLEDEAQLVDPQAVADLMSALDRVFKIGVYYPAGHTMCDQAAEHFMHAMERTLGKAPSLRFEVAGGVLSLQGMALEDSLRGVADFLGILEVLGVAAVELDSSLTSTDMHDFVTGLLGYRNRIKGARDFQQVVVEGMPPTVMIEHLEFTSHDLEEELDADGSSDTSQPRLETLLNALRQHGLTEAQIEQCRQLLQAIPGYLADADLDGAALPQVTWKDVEKLLIKAVGPQQEAGPGYQSTSSSPDAILGALTSIFEALGRRTDNANHNEALDLLLSMSKRGNPAAAGDEKPRPKPKPTPLEDLIPMSELRAAIDRCGAAADGDPQLMSENRCEELTILFQMLVKEQKLPVQARIRKRFRDILRTPLEDDEQAVLVAGVQQMLALDPAEHAFGPLLLVTDALRGSEFVSGMVVLAAAAAEVEPGRLPVLWPFLVNEILMTGRGREHEAFAAVAAAAAGAADEVLAAGLEDLEKLPALKNKRCARDVFSEPSPDLCRVFAALLDRPQSVYVGSAVLEGLRRNPMGWLCKAVVPLVTRFQPKYRHLLIALLNNAGRDRLTDQVAEAAGRVISELLPNLSGRSRTEAWVPDAVRAVGQVRMPRKRHLLERILRTRRFLIFHEWPAPCRAAAAEVLESLRESPTAVTSEPASESPPDDHSDSRSG